MRAILRNPIVRLLFVTAPCVAAAFAARAQSRPPLPPEAYAACESKKFGDACSVSFQKDKLEGTCAASDEGKLFCRLARPPPPPDGAPPPGDRPPPPDWE
jgi:hypothetical protein